MNKPEVLWLDNPFDLSSVSRYTIDQPQTIRQWLDGHGGDARLNQLPTVCVKDGKELLRADYDQPINGPVCFITLPTGGDSGSNPIAMIAMIALTVWTGGLAAAGYGSLAAGGSFTAGMISAGIAVGGAMLINMVFPPPGLPNSASPSAGSPTYSLGAQGNAARLGAPIPVNYGKMRIYPDFAAQPYSEYESNEQYLYQLFCIGQGQNQLSDLRLEDTPIENFAEVTTEVIPPLGKVTLFHTAVVTAPEAGGQDMTDPITLGPYVLNAVETEVSRIAVDVVFPGGLMGVDEDDGDEYSVAVHLNITAETIDDDGNPTGAGVTIFNSSISDCTRTAIRRTLAADVAPGRYRVTVSRTTGKGPDHEVRNCSLGAVKGYLVDDNEYGDVTLLAMRVRASANLSDSAARMVNILSERLIPVWSPDGWSQPRLTRNPAWAFADAVRSRYGGDFADSELDLDGLLYLAGLFDSRGDKFDGRFDTEQSLWDGLGKIGQVCRSGPVRQGNLIRLIRDQHIEAPAQVFSMANMADFSVDYVMHDDRTADAVKVTYWDETRDYTETTITCQLPNDTADNPQEVTLFGCTNYEQAWREGMYLAASNRERRQMVSWSTGLEGHIPTFGDLVIINHDLMGAGQQFGGIVEAVNGAVLTLSSDIEADGEHWYCILRDRYGEPSAPLPIEVVTPNQVRVLDTLPYIEEDTSREPTHYLIGQGAKVSWPVKVTAISPEADNKITIAGCIESEFVHTADKGVLPPPPPEIKPPPPGLVINNLLATQGGTVSAPVIFLSWDIAKGADRYLIEYSTDGRETWQPAGTGQSFINQHEFAAEAGLLTCRVAAVGAIRGEWADINVNAGGDFDTPGKVQPVLAEPFTGDALKVRWDKQPAAARYVLRVFSRGSEVRAVYLERTITDYHYFYTDAQQDAAGRTLTIKVAAENGNGVLGEYGEVTATNPPPAAPAGVVVEPLIDSFIVRAHGSDDTDIREFRVYGTQDAGFVPGIENLLYASATPWASLALKGRWYFRCAWVDQWGATDLNFSVEASGDSGAVDLGPVEDELADLNDKIGIVGGDIGNIETDLSGFETGLNTEISQRKTADNNINKRIDTNVSKIGQNTAAIIEESETRASADETLSRQISTVISEYEEGDANNSVAIQQEVTARTSADSALGKRIDTVTANYQAGDRTNSAAIQEETEARADADGALGKRLDTVQAVANGNKATVQQHATAIATVENGVEKLETSWGVTLDVNGYCAGFAMNNDGDSAEALFRADTFAVGSPGVKELTFVVKDGAVMMPGLSIQNGTIVASKLSANSVTAGKIAANTITGNEISSATTITAGTGAKTAGMNGAVDPNNPEINDIRFWAGTDADNIENANYTVSSSGELFARNARFENNIMVGSTVTAANFIGSYFQGGIVKGTTIIGSKIISTVSEYAVDPDETGTLRYYENYPDEIVTCLAKIISSSPKTPTNWGTWMIYDIPIVPTAYYKEEPNSSRPRWGLLNNYAFYIELYPTGNISAPDNGFAKIDITVEKINLANGSVISAEHVRGNDFSSSTKYYQFNFFGIAFEAHASNRATGGRPTVPYLGILKSVYGNTPGNSNYAFRVKVRQWATRTNSGLVTNYRLHMNIDNEVHP